jgi:hypothetical protein
MTTNKKAAPKLVTSEAAQPYETNAVIVADFTAGDTADEYRDLQRAKARERRAKAALMKVAEGMHHARRSGRRGPESHPHFNT